MIRPQSANSKQVLDIRAYRPSLPCPVCGELIGALSGSRDAICKNCGYKEPCCE